MVPKASVGCRKKVKKSLSGGEAQSLISPEAEGGLKASIVCLSLLLPPISPLLLHPSPPSSTRPLSTLYCNKLYKFSDTIRFIK